MYIALNKYIITLKKFVEENISREYRLKNTDVTRVCIIE